MKRFLGIALSLVLVLTVAGCTDGGKTVDGKPVTLRIGLPGGKNLTPMEIVDSFKAANPNIEVLIDEAPWNDFKTKLRMQIAASNPPDVFFTDSGYTATLGDMGAAVDLSDRIKKDLNVDEYTSGLLSGTDANGRIWGVPHALNPVAILYNKNMFDKEGIPYPDENWTFQDMLDIAAKLSKDTDGDGINDIYGFTGQAAITEGWLPFVLSSGGAPIDETRTKSMFNDPKTIEGIKKFEQTVKTGIAPSYGWISANGNKLAAFYMGKIGIITAQISGVKAINANAPEGFKYDAQIMPVGWDGKRNCIYVPNHWSIFSRTPEDVQNAAWKWLKHYLSEESQNLVAVECPGGIPLRKSALEKVGSNIKVPDNIEAFYKGIDDYGVTLFEGPKWQEWVSEVAKSFNHIYNGVASAEDTVAEMHRSVQAILDGTN